MTWEHLTDLRQMAIWSLTQERIDKLKREIGDKEEEFKTLTNTSSKQIWAADLNDFLAEWKFQLDDEARRAKKSAAQGRRASTKLRIGGKAGTKKRKADESDDSDFAVSKPKKSAPTAISKPKPSSQFDWMKNSDPAPKPKASQSLISAFGQKPPPKPQSSNSPSGLGLDGSVDLMPEDDFKPEVTEPKQKAPFVEPSGKQVKRSRPAKKAVASDDEEDEDDMFVAIAKEVKAKPAAASRQSRAASRKPVKYINSEDSADESNDSDGNHLLGDVSNMVKGIPKDPAATVQAKPLFSASRPSSSSSHGLTSSTKPSKQIKDDSDIDETDYRSLVPKTSPQKPAARKAREIVLSDEEDDSSHMVVPRAALKTTSTKVLAGKSTAGVLKPKKPSTTGTESKAKPGAVKEASKPKADLSPAAKAYKAKQDKTKAAASQTAPARPKLTKKTAKHKAESSDDDADALANDIIGDDDEENAAPVEPKGRYSRRAAAAAPKSRYVFDDDDDDEDEDASDAEDFDDGDE